jgi:adenylate cyclase
MLAEQLYLAAPKQASEHLEVALQLSRNIQFAWGEANCLGWLAYLYEQTGDIDRALDYYNKSLAYYETQPGKKSDLAVVLNNIAAIYKDKGRLNEAMQYHWRSLGIAKEIKRKDLEASSYGNIGLIYFNQGKILEALDLYTQALKLNEETGDADGVITILQNIGSLYQDQGQYTEALHYFKRTLDLCLQISDRYSLGYTYNYLGKLHDQMGRQDSAMIYHQKALDIRNEIDDQQGIAHSLKNMGIMYEKMARHADAKLSFERSLKIFERIDDNWGVAVVTNKLGGLLLRHEQNYSQAEALLLQSLALSKSLGYPLDIRNAAENLQFLYRMQGSWKRALDMNDLYIAMRDSTQNDNIRKSTLKAQLRYEYELKVAAYKSEQIKKDAIVLGRIAEQKVIRNGLLVGLGVMAGFAFFVFKQRNRISKEKQRSDMLLLNILPAETAAELRQTGEAKAKKYDDATVMFTDFTNFTQAAEQLSPEALVAEINHCYSEFDKIITRHGIEKIKTIGDSYMAASGLPSWQPNHAERMVRAAIEIRDFVDQYFQTSPLGKYGGGIRIGIHSGAVVAGIVGINKFAYDIWGDTVNIASRMESSGEAGKINISAATYGQVKKSFVAAHRGKVHAKNKGDVDMYFVEA